MRSLAAGCLVSLMALSGTIRPGHAEAPSAGDPPRAAVRSMMTPPSAVVIGTCGTQNEWPGGDATRDLEAQNEALRKLGPRVDAALVAIAADPAEPAWARIQALHWLGGTASQAGRAFYLAQLRRTEIEATLLAATARAAATAFLGLYRPGDDFGRPGSPWYGAKNLHQGVYELAFGAAVRDEAVVALTPLLAHADADVRRAAAEGLGRAWTLSARRALRAAYEVERDDAVRADIFDALRNHGSASRDAVRAFLSAHEEGPTIAEIQLLGTGAERFLIEAAADESLVSGVRMRAFGLLRGFPGADTFSFVEAQIRRRDLIGPVLASIPTPYVFLAGVRPPDEVAAAIVPLLAHADQGVRWAAASALRFVQTPNVIAALQRARKSEKDPRVRAMIDESLVPRPLGAPADRARIEARDARISE